MDGGRPEEAHGGVHDAGAADGARAGGGAGSTDTPPGGSGDPAGDATAGGTAPPSGAADAAGPGPGPRADAAPLDGPDAAPGAQPDAAPGVQADDASMAEPDATAADAGPPGCDPTRGPQLGRFGLRTVISSTALAGLTEATQPPGSNDWYLVEQRGRILILRDGVLRPEPFLDLSAEIALTPPPVYEDRGLVSIAFAPDYASSGRFYVSVTPTLGAQANYDLLLEFTRSASDADRADVGTRRTVVEARGTSTSASFLRDIHNGGRATFGPDGMLYLALGDGGGINCADIEPDATQNVGSLFGKLLRLDLTQPAPHGATDNPFVSDGDPRVLHYGLRNPFRFSFDRLTGDLYLGDVGQNRYEEIDYAPAGARGLNFGWAPYEGASRDTCPSRQLRAGSVHTAPIFVADRRASASNPFSDYTAMIGGVVYRGSALPQLFGAYVFGGYQGRRLGALYQCGAATSPVTPILKSCDPNAPNDACLRSLDGAPVFRELRSIVEDHAGELYVVANGNSLLQIVPDVP